MARRFSLPETVSPLSLSVCVTARKERVEETSLYRFSKLFNTNDALDRGANERTELTASDEWVNRWAQVLLLCVNDV